MNHIEEANKGLSLFRAKEYTEADICLQRLVADVIKSDKESLSADEKSVLADAFYHCALFDVFHLDPLSPKDLELAVSILEIALERLDPKNVKIHRLLGLAYIENLQFEDAVSILFSGGKLDDTTCMAELSILLMFGKGVDEEQGETALSFARQTAKEGNVLGMYALGVLFLRASRGVEKDLAKAEEWTSMAIANGFKPAQKLLERIKKERKGKSGPFGSFKSLFGSNLFDDAKETIKEYILNGIKN